MLNLTNKEIIFLYRWLNIPLHGEELRTRTRFLGMLQTQRTEYDKEREDKIKNYGKKDENGKIVIENGEYVFEDGQKDVFAKELSDLLEKVAEYEIDGDNKKTLKSMYNVLSTKLVRGMDIDEGAVYDAVLTKFEEIIK